MPEKFVVFLPLVARDSTGVLRGVLATHWEHSADYHTWTIHLRSDVRWHDGVPFTVRDIEFTLHLLADSSVQWASPDAYAIAVLDDTTYTLRYKEFGPGSPLDDWTVYYPRHLLKDLDPKQFAEWHFWLAPVGDGPYRFVRIVPRTMMEFEANPDFYRGPPAVQRLVIKFGSPELTELMSGAVDVMQPNPIDVLRLTTDPRYRVNYEFWFVNVDAVGWNQTRPPFDDVRVRRAMTLAINRRELQRLLGYPEATPILDGPLTDRRFRDGPLIAPTPYDPDAARHLLDQAGWVERQAGGVRARNGRSLRITATVGNLFEQPRIAVYLQEQLRRVGVEMRIEQGTLAVVARRLRAHDFDAVLLHMPFRGEWSGMHLLEPGSPLGYENLRAGALFARIRATLDPHVLDSAYQELTRLFQVDMPMTFLAPGVAFTVARAEVHGLSSPYAADPFMRVGDLRIAPNP